MHTLRWIRRSAIYTDQPQGAFDLAFGDNGSIIERSLSDGARTLRHALLTAGGASGRRAFNQHATSYLASITHVVLSRSPMTPQEVML